ncbi:MAG: SPW repeat protein [Nocardioides sp.]
MATSDANRPHEERRTFETRPTYLARPSDSTPGRRRAVAMASGSNLVLGLWLILAPFALGYSGVGGALWDDMVVGVAVAVLAGFRVTAGGYRQSSLSWTNAALGAWLAFAPWVLSYAGTTAAVANDITVGLIVVTLATVSAVTSGADRDRW